MKKMSAIALSSVLASCSEASEPLPIQTKASLGYQVAFEGLGSDKVTVYHEFTRQADGTFEIHHRVEGSKDDGKSGKTRRCDAYGIEADGTPHCFFLASKAPIFMPSTARQVGATFHSFRVKEELQWNGHAAVRVAGRDNWTWYYSKDNGMFLGGHFVIGAGGIRIKLTGAEGFGSS